MLGSYKMHFFSFMFSLDWLGIRWVYLDVLFFFSHVRYLKENENSAMFFSFRYSTWFFNHTRLLISPRKCIRIVCILDPWPVWIVFEFEDDLRPIHPYLIAKWMYRSTRGILSLFTGAITLYWCKNGPKLTVG